MIKTLRYRLLAWFLVFVILTTGLILPASMLYHNHEKRITMVTRQIAELHIDFLKDTKAVNDFLSIEPLQTDFFTKGESPYLNYHLESITRLESDILQLKESRQSRSYNIYADIETLEQNISDYNVITDSLVYLVFKRGFYNSGLEGELVDYGKMIESAPGITRYDAYNIKKMENDYFFNNSRSSMESLQEIITSISRSVQDNTLLSEHQKKNTIDLLNAYNGAFLRLVELDEHAGISKNVALKAALNSKSSEIEVQFSALSDNTADTQRALINKLNIYYFFSVLLIISLAILFSYWVSKRIVTHLEALSNYISILAKNNTTEGPAIDFQKSAREVKLIYREFRNLLSQLNIWENQRNKALKRAEDTQQRYQELAEMLPQSIFETDDLGNYTYVNKAWYKAFGYTAADLHEGLNLIETLISETNQEEILRQKKIENLNFTAIRKDGTRFPASLYSDNITKDGAVKGRRGIIIDITDRVNYIRTLQQETTRAKTSDELKSSFLANMSHEIRTPMNSIIGFSNLLSSDKIPETQKKDFTKYIRSSSEILMNLVDDIIDIAKIEAGELKIVKKECHLKELCTELLNTSNETLKRYNKLHLQINFIADENKPDLAVKTDPYRLRQILINLINNAIKFTDTGSIDFGYKILDDTQIEFFVKDTGMGLSREELDLIFERFKRSKKSDEKNIIGTGLGLAISKNLVKLLGGDMWVESVVGTGTTFIFNLPFLRTTVLKPESRHVYRKELSYNWEGKTILVAEDDTNSYRFLNELLKKTKAVVRHAYTGLEAIDIIKSKTAVDIVIMDIQLPEVNGIEATKQIKLIQPSLPVIAQTAFAMAGDKERLKKAGFDDYVAKPVDMDKLLSIINHYLFSDKKTVKSSGISQTVHNN